MGEHPATGEPVVNNGEMRGGRGGAAHHRRPSIVPRCLIAAGLVLVAAVAGWQLYASVWTAHSQRAGRALVHHFLDNHALAAPLPRTTHHVTAPSPANPSRAALLSCSSAGGSDGSNTTPVHGLLEIPGLGVVAPVEQGVGDAQLAVAVGHDPYSVWPGAPGNAVLDSHDVSYFSNIASLRPGDVLRYVTPCTTYIFHVSSHAIVTQGAPVYNTADPTVTLVTCWPTDALWFTPERYLVTATEVGSVPSGSSTRYITTATPPRVPAPAALVAQGVTLATYSLPMGTFTLGGTPNKGWAQTTNPLLVEGSGVEAFIAAVRSLTEDHLDWWRQLAPGVAAPRALIGAENPDYMTPTNVSEFAWGSNVTSVTLAGTFRVSGGSEPGIYAVSVTERIDAGVLTIASWTMQVA